MQRIYNLSNNIKFARLNIGGKLSLTLFIWLSILLSSRLRRYFSSLFCTFVCEMGEKVEASTIFIMWEISSLYVVKEVSNSSQK